MAKEYDNELRGVLFKNDERKDETQPVMGGDCQIEGVVYKQSVWGKTAKKTGKKFWSCAFVRKEDQPEKRESEPPKEVESNDIPF